jgi:DNA-binding transcriptional LysR family regulator
MDFELRLLRAALALAEHRNFARAAKAVHVSQPALSRAIQELEQRAGTRLFDRTSQGAEATDAGVILLDHARDVMSRASDLGREMDLLKGLETGELRIGAGTYPSHMYVDRALGRLVREHPSVRISVANDNWANLLPLLRKREIDLAVIDATAASADPEMRVIRLQPRQGYFALRPGHPLRKLQGADQLAEVWNYPFVSTSRFSSVLFKELAGVRLGPQKSGRLATRGLTSIACESLYMMMRIAAESDAVALLPLNVIVDEVERGRLAAFPAPDWLRGNFGIVHLAHRSLSPLGETFVRMVQEVDAETQEWELKTVKRLFPEKEPPRSKPTNRRLSKS